MFDKKNPRIDFMQWMNVCSLLNLWKDNTGGPRYMLSFYLRIRVYANEKWPFFWNLSSNLQWSLVFLYANSLYASIFLESLSESI